MKLLLFVIGRLIVIAFALAISVLAASLFIGYGLASGMLAEILGQEGHEKIMQSEAGETILGIATFVAAVLTSTHIAGLTLLPVTIAIAATEMMRWQSMSLHLVLGGLCALFVLFSALALPTGQMPANGTVVVTLAAGFVAAFFYWLIAGRNSGEWWSAIENDEESATN